MGFNPEDPRLLGMVPGAQMQYELFIPISQRAPERREIPSNGCMGDRTHGPYDP